MGVISSMVRSFKKSRRLRKLQLAISPPNENIQSMAARMLSEGSEERARALHQFLDLCESDDGVAQVLTMEGATRSDLEDIYRALLLNGLGRWIKGHYAALSTLAYAEPLLFTLRARTEGRGISDIAFTLLEYWEGKIRQGTLLEH